MATPQANISWFVRLPAPRAGPAREVGSSEADPWRGLSLRLAVGGASPLLVDLSEADYRWGNPLAYGAGTEAEQQLSAHHDAQWNAPGVSGEGNILVFNNGTDRPEGRYSSVDEIVPRVDAAGQYPLAAGEPWGPATPTWTWAAPTPSDFYAARSSSAQRLPNGNTLICHGPQGTFFEVTPDGRLVWQYVNPVGNHGPLMQGEPIPVTAQAQVNRVFRVRRYAADHPGLAGRDLSPIRSGPSLCCRSRAMPIRAVFGAYQHLRCRSPCPSVPT